MTRSKTFSPKKCSQQAKRIQRILLAAVLIAGAMFLLWGKAQKPEMLDVELEEIKMISYGSESIGITEPEQLRQEYARLNEVLARQDELRELYRQLHDPNPSSFLLSVSGELSPDTPRWNHSNRNPLGGLALIPKKELCEKHSSFYPYLPFSTEGDTGSIRLDYSASGSIRA